MARIWYQSISDLDVLGVYDRTLTEHLAKVAAKGTEIVLHGMVPGRYPPGVSPLEVNRDPYARLLAEVQLCEAARTAEREGYDAVIFGCIFDPGLRAAQAAVDIPVIGMAEAVMLSACSMGERFSFIAMNDFQESIILRLVRENGLIERLASIEKMPAGTGNFALEAEGEKAAPLVAAFREACTRALDGGAEVVIPGDAGLNAFIVRAGWVEFEGAVLLDSTGITVKFAEFQVAARAALGPLTARRRRAPRMSDAARAHVRRDAGLEDVAEQTFSGRQERIGGQG